MLGVDTLAPFDKQRFIELYNGGSAEIPAFGCYEIYDAERPDAAEALVLGGGRTVLKVRQPTSDNVANFGINGALPLPASTYGGFGTQDYPTYAAYDAANSPAFGEEWGPQSGSCLIKKNNRGLTIYGDASGGLVRVGRRISTDLYSPTIADLSGTLSANTWSSGAYPTGGASPTLPTASGTVYGLVAGKLVSIASSATISNPLPFSFASGSQVRVAYHAGSWVVLGPANGAIRHHSVGSSPFPSSYMGWPGGSDAFGIAVSAGDSITIGTSLTGGAFSTITFRVEWWAQLTLQTGGSGSAFLTTTSLEKNGVNLATTSHGIATVAAGVVLTLNHHHHGFTDVALSQGDVLKLGTSYTGGGGLAADGALTITPLLGGL